MNRYALYCFSVFKKLVKGGIDMDRAAEEKVVKEKIIEILAEHLEQDKSKITLESSIVDDLGADSLDVVDIVKDIEDEFSVEIPESEIENMKTVGDIVSFIE